jgi:predicted nucleotidyltransferase
MHLQTEENKMNDYHKTAEIVAKEYSKISQVESITLAGSQTSGMGDLNSDIDLYVYYNSVLPISLRKKIATSFASEKFEVDNQFWEPGDEWIDSKTNIHVDVMFRDMEWIQDGLDRVLKQHQASVGYSTCILHNILHSKILFDGNGWFRSIQEKAQRPYPEKLVKATVAKNYPILKKNMSSYMYQLNSAVQRNDLVSINHRITALLESYFDILFAINHLPHPGEKRLVQIASEECLLKPAGMEEHIKDLLKAIGTKKNILNSAAILIDGLSELLISEGLIEN